MCVFMFKGDTVSGVGTQEKAVWVHETLKAILWLGILRAVGLEFSILPLKNKII